MGLTADFISLFFPRYCRACMDGLVSGEEILCTRCLSILPVVSPLLEDTAVEQKLAGRLPLKQGWSFLRFRKGGIVQSLLHELKYKNHPEIGVGLGRLFGNELLKAGWINDVDIIVPVPLHASRKRKRGYNQSSLIAQGLSYSIGRPWDESISIRKASTTTQTSKTRADRWENVKDVFAISGEGRLSGKRVLLVDDVITTGATLEACGQHILASGCTELSVACLAEAQ